MTLEERFWKKVQKTPSCWEWKGHITHFGYGILVNKLGLGYKMAHRVSLEIHGIKLIDGFVADHMCRNRSCVNPEHLRQVTRGINTLENSNSIQAKNKLKVACPKGHPYDLISGGRRYCRRCKNERGRQWRAKHK